MTLQEFFYFTGSIAFIIFMIYALLIILVIAFLSQKIANLIVIFEKIAQNGARASEEAKFLAFEIINKIRRFTKIG